ncbi:helix-turn-helix domain-containing protein [Streptomyces sp. bgisy082]|uniref:helix-turn-helix domain-containing protein n=1 Tax=Streptomyces sp. bgisy082 TaxID=3413776 RepID=UPI003D753BF2
MAQQGGLGPSTVAHAFSGKRLPSRETLIKIIETLSEFTPGRQQLGPEMKAALLEQWQAAWQESRRLLDQPPAAIRERANALVASLTPLEEHDGGESWALDSKGSRAAVEDVAAATAALDAAMDRLEHATTEVAAARAALRDATERAAVVLRPAKAPAARDTDATDRTDDTGPGQ